MMKMRRNLKKLLSVLMAATFLSSFMTAIPVQAGPESSAEAELSEIGRLLRENEDEDAFAFRGQETRRLFRGAAYPDSYDLRNVDTNGDGTGDKNYVTSVKYQNPFGTCWGFAAIAASESSILSSGLATDADSLNLSEKHLTFFTRRPIDDPSDPQNGEGYIFRGSAGDSRIFGEGNFYYATSLFSSGMGPVQESVNALFEYHGQECLNNGSYYSASDNWWIEDSSLRWKQSYVLSESYMLPSPSTYVINGNTSLFTEAVNAIKEQIKNGRAVSISFCADTSQPGQTATTYYISPNWAHYTYEARTPNHGVTIIGWDDNYPKENFAHNSAPIPSQNGAWLVKNSWGSMENEFPNRGRWGLLQGQDKGVNNDGTWEYNAQEGAVNTGYFWLSYEDKSIDLVEAFDFDRVNNDDLYVAQYDLMPVSGYTVAFSEAAYKMANIFDVEQVTKGDKGGRLESVSCITFTPGTYVTYEIYVLNDGATDPTDGEKIATMNQTYAYGGFHRKNLSAPYLLRKGQRFSVVVTQKTPTPDDKYVVNQQMELNATGVLSNSLFYSKGVINEGESMLYLPGSGTWADLSTPAVRTAFINNSQYDMDNFPIKAYISKPTVSDFPDPSITVPTAKTDLVYDKNEHELITAGSVEGGTMEYALANSSGQPGTYSNDIPKATAAKTYRVFYKAIVGGEVVGADSIAVTIGKKPLTVNWTGGDSWKYDKSEHGPVAELEGVIEGTDVSAVVEGNKQTDAGSYIAKVTGLNGVDAGNYSLPSSASTKSYSITKRRITLTSGSATAQYQEGTALTENSVTVSGDGFASKDGVEEGVNWTVTGSRTAPGESPNTFTYTFKSGTRAGNYDITTNFGTLTVNWWSDEQKSEHIVEIESKSKETEYNGRVQTVSGFKDGSETVTVGDETFRVTGLTAEGSGTTVGTYSNIISGTAVIERASGEDVTSHFMIEYKNGILTIKPKDIKDARIALENELKYTGSEQTQEISVRVDGTVLTKGTDYEVSGDKATAAGTHTLTVTGKGNYTGSATKEYTITNPELTGISVTQDGTLSYNGYGQTPKLKTTADQSDVTFTYAESESSTFTSGIPTFKDAKEHTLYYRAEKSGYTPKTGTVTIKIDKITLGVIWEGISFTYDGSSHAPTAKPLGVVGSDSIRYNVSGAASNAGTHTARITGAEGTGVDNYNLPPSSDMECTFRIVKQSSNSTNNSSSNSSNSSKTAANTSSGSSKSSNSTSKTTANTSSGSSKSTASTSSGSTKTTANTSTGSSKTSNSKTTANTSSGNSKTSSGNASGGSSGGSRTDASSGTGDMDDNGSGNTDSKDTDKTSKSSSKSSKTAKEIAENTKLEDNESALKAAIGEEKFKELSDSGATPSIRLNMKPIDKVPDGDKKAIEDAVKDQLSSIPNLVVAEYFDITLEVKEDGEWEAISSTQSPVRLVAKIPESLKKKAAKFFMMRLHGGDTTLLEDKDDDPDSITVESDEFSTYALLYQKAEGEEKEKETEVSEQETSADENMTAQITDKTPDTGAGNPAVVESDDSGSEMWRVWVFAAILLLIAGGVAAAILVPKLKNRE